MPQVPVGATSYSGIDLPVPDIPQGPRSAKSNAVWTAKRYGLAVATSAATVVVSALLEFYSVRLNLALLVLVALLVPAWYGGKGPGLLAVVLLEAVTILTRPMPQSVSIGQYVFSHLSILTVYVIIVLLVSSRRKAERLLKQRSKLLQVTLASIGDAVVTTDSDGKIMFLNATAEKLSGLSAKDCGGRLMMDAFSLVKESTRTPVVDPVMVVMRAGSIKGRATKLILRRKDGTEVPIEATGAPIKIANGETIGVIFVFRDITLRKEAEKSLKRQALVIEQSYESIIVWDMENGILEWNAGSERLYGYQAEEAVGRPCYDLLEAVYPVSKVVFLEELRANSWWYGQVRHRAKDQKEVVVEARYKLLKIDGREVVFQTNRDITAQIAAENALGQSEVRYRQLFKNNPMPMWLYDLETLKFLAVNDAAVSHYGYSEDEFLSKSITEIRPAENVPKLLENLTKTPSSVEYGPDWTHTRKDGSVINVEITSHEEVFNGRPARLVLANDVTGRRKVERAMLELNENLEQRVTERTEKLAAANKELEAFSYSVSHDLRAPLRAIDGFSRIFAEDYADKLDEEGTRVLNVIRNNAQNMGRLIDDLLAFSRLGRKDIEPEVVDMTDLVTVVSSEIVSASPAKSISFNIDPIPTINGDGAPIRQVFVNLCSNAVKYSGTRSKIDVHVGSNVIGDENVYYIRDNGVGFDMKYADKLFGVFQRLHGSDEFEGTGVGLAIVQRIVHRHGGRVWAESEVDKGATFYFALPRVSTRL